MPCNVQLRHVEYKTDFSTVMYIHNFIYFCQKHMLRVEFGAFVSHNPWFGFGRRTMFRLQSYRLRGGFR
jgi:hypothetical protein